MCICYLTFLKNNDNVAVVHKEFRCHIILGRHNRVPSANAIKTWIHNLKETGSAMKKQPPGRLQTARIQTIFKLFQMLS